MLQLEMVFSRHSKKNEADLGREDFENHDELAPGLLEEPATQVEEGSPSKKSQGSLKRGVMLDYVNEFNDQTHDIRRYEAPHEGVESGVGVTDELPNYLSDGAIPKKVPTKTRRRRRRGVRKLPFPDSRMRSGRSSW